MNHLSPSLSPEENEQILQTIEMFKDEIVQASPNDTQSLEILKEAYLRGGMIAESVQLGRKLAGFICAVPGSTRRPCWNMNPSSSSSLQMWRSSLRWGKVEEKMKEAGQTRQMAPQEVSPMPDFGSVPVEGGSLIASSQTFQIKGVEAIGSSPPKSRWFRMTANEALAKFLILHKIVPESVVKNPSGELPSRTRFSCPISLSASLFDRRHRPNWRD